MSFVSYAVTLICSVLPCTQVIHWDSSLLVPQKIIHSHSQGLYYVPHHFQNKIETGDLELETAASDLYGSEKKFIAVHSDQSVQNDGEKVKEKEDLGGLGDEYPEVQIRDGWVKGFTMMTIRNRSVSAWKAIPFAKPPVGELRFKAPKRPDPWDGVRDSFGDSPTCIQTDFMQQYKIHGQEDCLYLNVYAPKRSQKDVEREKLPVLVFIHGGGWFFSTSSLYGPAYILDQENVVLVTLNYRLGLLGFLATGDTASPGNFGLKDQSLALRWVNENIHSFGGDPDRVVIFGESAGAGSVHFHMFSPMSRGLFSGGISQSGCATCFWSLSEKAPEIARKYATFLSCDNHEDSEQLVQCLRKKDATELVQMQLAFLEWTMYPVVIFGPVVEPNHPTAFLTERPEDLYEKAGAVAPVPWISGFNEDEGAINIATLFIGNESASQLNRDWNKFGPIFLDLKNTEENSVGIANKIKQFYLDENSIELGMKDDLVKMFSDRYVINCGVKGIQLHAKHSSSPVYAYRLGFRGKYSIVQLLGQKAQDWGVSHMDDLIYLFNNTAYYPTLNVEDEEYQVSQQMIKMWTNFAKTGKPALSFDQNVNKSLEWKAVRKDVTLTSSINYFDITLKPKMIQDPFIHRVNFWRSLKLQDA